MWHVDKVQHSVLQASRRQWLLVTDTGLPACVDHSARQSGQVRFVTKVVWGKLPPRLPAFLNPAPTAAISHPPIFEPLLRPALPTHKRFLACFATRNLCILLPIASLRDWQVLGLRGHERLVIGSIRCSVQEEVVKFWGHAERHRWSIFIPTIIEKRLEWDVNCRRPHVNCRRIHDSRVVSKSILANNRSQLSAILSWIDVQTVCLKLCRYCLIWLTACEIAYTAISIVKRACWSTRKELRACRLGAPLTLRSIPWNSIMMKEQKLHVWSFWIKVIETLGDLRPAHHAIRQGSLCCLRMRSLGFEGRPYELSPHACEHWRLLTTVWLCREKAVLA